MVLGDNMKRLVLIGWNDFTWDTRQRRTQNPVSIYGVQVEVRGNCVCMGESIGYTPEQNVGYSPGGNEWLVAGGV